jgi:hypothetical protein
MILPTTLVVLWSPHQNAFSIETVDDMLKANLAVFLDGNKGDFILLGFAETLSNARDLGDVFMEKRNQRLRIDNPSRLN